MGIFLHKGNAGGTDGNWYLRSELPQDHNRSRSHNRSHTPRRINRTEGLSSGSGLLYCEHSGSQTLFNIRMHDREGETYYTDVLLVRRKQQVCGCVISAVIIAEGQQFTAEYAK